LNWPIVVFVCGWGRGGGGEGGGGVDNRGLMADAAHAEVTSATFNTIIQYMMEEPPLGTSG
jgi:hypothetical protein